MALPQRVAMVAVLVPAFGDGKMLSEQQMADLIAYVLYLNGVERSQ
jgi:uncharacterized protein (DUF934 family)